MSVKVADQVTTYEGEAQKATMDDVAEGRFVVITDFTPISEAEVQRNTAARLAILVAIAKLGEKHALSDSPVHVSGAKKALLKHLMAVGACVSMERRRVNLEKKFAQLTSGMPQGMFASDRYRCGSAELKTPVHLGDILMEARRAYRDATKKTGVPGFAGVIKELASASKACAQLKDGIYQKPYFRAVGDGDLEKAEKEGRRLLVKVVINGDKHGMIFSPGHRGGWVAINYDDNEGYVNGKETVDGDIKDGKMEIGSRYHLADGEIIGIEEGTFSFTPEWMNAGIWPEDEREQLCLLANTIVSEYSARTQVLPKLGSSAAGTKLAWQSHGPQWMCQQYPRWTKARSNILTGCDLQNLGLLAGALLTSRAADYVAESLKPTMPADTSKVLLSVAETEKEFKLWLEVVKGVGKDVWLPYAVAKADLGTIKNEENKAAKKREVEAAATKAVKDTHDVFEKMINRHAMAWARFAPEMFADETEGSFMDALKKKDTSKVKGDLVARVATRVDMSLPETLDSWFETRDPTWKAAAKDPALINLEKLLMTPIETKVTPTPSGSSASPSPSLKATEDSEMAQLKKVTDKWDKFFKAVLPDYKDAATGTVKEAAYYANIDKYARAESKKAVMALSERMYGKGVVDGKICKGAEKFIWAISSTEGDPGKSQITIMVNILTKSEWLAPP